MAGAVSGFAAFMTGEVFAVLCQHSILGRTMTHGPVDWRAFEHGVERAAQWGGLLHHLLGARTRVLLGELAAAGQADYLSGMLIGHEMLAAGGGGPVAIIGTADLAERCRRASDRLGRPAEVIPGDAARASSKSASGKAGQLTNIRTPVASRTRASRPSVCSWRIAAVAGIARVTLYVVGVYM